ncbi:MAG: hypothetical protein IJM54_04160 [Thermoguttaceae bacterium]|nr:hypothetical protein [Thermoguttaceae bacterium]
MTPIVIQDKIKLKNREDANEFRRTAPEILDKEGAARFLGVSVRSLVENLNAESIPHKTIGQVLIFSRDALVEWVKHIDS